MKTINFEKIGSVSSILEQNYLAFYVDNSYTDPVDQEDDSFMGQIMSKSPKKSFDFNVKMFERLNEPKHSLVMQNGFEVLVEIALEGEQIKVLFVPPTNIIADLTVEKHEYFCNRRK
jgi:hypothetical protein